MTSLLINFWGHRIRFFLNNPIDKSHLEFYFRDLLVDNNLTSNLEYRCTSDHGNGFFDALRFPYIEKLIEKKGNNGQWHIYERFSEFSKKPTILPPISSHPDLNNIFMSHAACLAYPNDNRCVMLAGASFSGKTTLSLELANRGWTLLTDDLSIVKIPSLEVVPFFRPLTLRNDIEKRLPWLSDRLIKDNVEVRRIEHLRLIRSNDLFKTDLTTKYYIHSFITLTNSDIYSSANLQKQSHKHSIESIYTSAKNHLRKKQATFLINNIEFYTFNYQLDIGIVKLAKILEDNLER